MSAVVVVLPLVPVMPTTVPRQRPRKRSISTAQAQLYPGRHLRERGLKLGGGLAVGDANFLARGSEMRHKRDAAARRADHQGGHT
ncbi:MAG: hypothetical protein E6I96_08015 [Chloroflexi bacterium]|nr:MAG: hypothetical protein E6I96_08015 [Chloroflexota bacterium]